MFPPRPCATAVKICTATWSLQAPTMAWQQQGRHCQAGHQEGFMLRPDMHLGDAHLTADLQQKLLPAMGTPAGRADISNRGQHLSSRAGGARALEEPAQVLLGCERGGRQHGSTQGILRLGHAAVVQVV